MDKILTLEEVAEYLRVSEKTVKEWVNKGELPGGKLGTSWRFRRGDIEEWVNKQLAPSLRPETPKAYTIKALLKAENIYIYDCASKSEILNKLISAAVENEKNINRAKLADAVYSREELMSTGIGLSIAIPHVRMNSIKDIKIIFALNKTPIEDYESIDNIPVQFIIFILAGTSQQSQYIQTLSAVSAVLKNELIRERIKIAKDSNEIFRILIEGEK